MLDIPTQHCERLVTGGFEPLNTISNIGFIIAAVCAFWMLRESKSVIKYVLPIILVSMGLGSALWHATHSTIGDIADTGTIVIFASVITILFLRKIFSPAFTG